MTQPIYQRVALIGLGLIGSSIAWASHRSGAAAQITGYARSAETRARAAELGFCQVAETAAAAVADADLIVLCTPVGVIGAVMQDIAPALKPGATITDVGSVKRAVVDAVLPHLPEGVHFVPGHPMAGTEYSGPDSGFAELFDNRWCLLTPLADGDPSATERLQKFWESLGADVECMDPDHHDLVAAVISHVPHAIAYTMCGVADDMNRVTNREVVQFSAAGFRDFTRIAASDPTMWRDVFLNNKEATIEVIGRFVEELMALQRSIRMEDGEFLHDYFTRTRAIRRSIIEAGQDTATPDFGRKAAAPESE